MNQVVFTSFLVIKCNILFTAMMIDAGHGLAGCIGDVSNEKETGLQERLIKSPNYKNESERNVSCNWTIDVPSSKYLVLSVIDLRLHYLDDEGILHCTPSHSLMINGSKVSSNSLFLFKTK